MNTDEVKFNSEVAFKALFQYATISILVVNRRGVIELANPSVEKLFGYTNDELVGKTLEILVPEDSRHKHTTDREGYFHKPKARPMGLGRDLTARKKDGSIFPVEIGLGYYSLNDEMFGVAFITDISERKKTEQKMIELNEELEYKVKERTLELTHSLEREKELNEMKSRFVSMASHEFRTPLSAVLSSISLIEQYAKEEQKEKRQRHIERIKSSVKNLTEILDDFLSLDRLEQGKVTTTKEEFDIKELLNDIAEDIHSMLKPGQKINLFSNGGKTIIQDKKILRNIFFNLLSNAIKYSPEEKEIIVSAENNNDKLEITVKDSGIGIPEAEQKYLFTKFFRAGNAGHYQGTGLGLNIVKRYVELLNGKIWFESRENEGTTFTVTLPK